MQAIRLNPTDIRVIDECSKYAVSVCKARACNPAILKHALELLLDLTKNPSLLTELKSPRTSTALEGESPMLRWKAVESRIRQLKELVTSRLG